MSLALPVDGVGTELRLASHAMDDARLVTHEDSFVYRGLRETEDPALGLWAKTPGIELDPISHIAGAKETPWSSASKSLEIARDKYGAHGVVRIDLNKVTTEVIDFSNGIPGMPSHYMLNRWVKSDQEVLIKDFIPPGAISIIR